MDRRHTAIRQVGERSCVRGAVLVVTLVVACAVAACGGSGATSTAADETTAAAPATSTAATATGACADGEVTMIVQQEIATLNALTSDITRDWFISPAKQKAGIAQARADLSRMVVQAKALRACAAKLSPAQEALVTPALAALASSRAFAEATIELAQGGTIKAAQLRLKQARPKMTKLTDELTRALAALSTQWENWKLDQR